MKKKIIFLAACPFLLCGCGKVETINITMNCEDKKVEKEVKVDDTLSCTLLGTEYKFTITEIDKKGENVTIEANEYGLTDTSSLLDKKKEFSIEKDKKLELTTQSTDYQEKVTFTYETK